MVKRWICGTGILYLFWIILSGRFEADLLIIGAVCSALVALICLPMMKVTAKGKVFFITDVNPVRLVMYLIWLFKEIFVSAVDVCRTVIFGGRVSPQMVCIRCGFENPTATVFLINSVTLTPGSIAVDIKEDEIMIHALTDSAAEAILSGEMMNRVAWLFREGGEVR